MRPDQSEDGDEYRENSDRSQGDTARPARVGADRRHPCLATLNLTVRNPVRHRRLRCGVVIIVRIDHRLNAQPAV